MLKTLTFVTVATMLALVAHSAVAAEIAAGPMAGARAMRSALLWVQADSAAEARIEYWNEREPNRRWQSAPIMLSASSQFATHFRINSLEPGQRYGYRVLLDGKASKVGDLSFTTQDLWQWRKDAPDFKIAMGSCTYVNDPDYDRPGRGYGGFFETLQSVAKQQPDMMLWLGDNVYLREADFDSAWGMAERYRHTRALPQMQALLRTGHHYAIWDDHDYGPNNANQSYAFKGEALDLFKRYWANPSYGLPGQPGTHSTFSFNDADFFLTDNRWYRDDDDLIGVGNKTMFGREQVRWLKNALMNSTAAFKFIVMGSQVLNDGSRSDGWHHYKAERDEFMKWLTEQKVNGVFFLSGDRHFTALYRQDREGTYPLHDLTCSPLTSGTHKQERERTNPRIVSGTLVEDKRNFCTFDFKGTRQAREFIIRVFDHQGVKQWERTITHSELTTPK